MNIVRVCLKTDYILPIDVEKIYLGKQAVNIFFEIIGQGSIERVGCIFLDVQHSIICYSTIGFGDTDKATINVSELFRIALLSNAKFIIVAHNHPSGVLTPTETDILITKQIGSAGKLFGIQLIDSLIIGYGGNYLSIREYIDRKENEK